MMAKRTRDRAAKEASDHAITSFEELHRRLAVYRHGDWYFRGHANLEWKLQPKAGRAPFAGQERILFDSWKRWAVE